MPFVDLEAALELVRPMPDGLLDVYPLATEINSSRNEGWSCSRRCTGKDREPPGPGSRDAPGWAPFMECNPSQTSTPD